ncbi:MAG: peptidase C25, partial [Bacteroidota bacterium]
MKNCCVFVSMLLTLFCFGQQKQFTIEWNGDKVLETAYGKITVPSFDAKHFNFDDESGLTFFTQWESNGTLIDENSIEFSGVSYETISQSDLKNLNPQLIPNTLKYRFFNTNARDKRGYFFEISPIIKDRGVYKKVKSFTINYSAKASRSSFAAKNSQITNSVLSTGDWYKFYIEETGVFQLTRGFLNSLGINTNSIDPRTIKIYGNGGRMLPLLNSANYPFDVVENAVRFVGEEDGSFDNGDYILFYGEGPTTYSEESQTNINLYTDKTYYYVNISPGNGKRIQAMPTIDAPADILIDTFQDYQFYEVDEHNLAKLGRRWFGDEFDIENQRVYNFQFPNLVTSDPVRFDIAVGSVSETDGTTMGITINGNFVSSLNLGVISSGSVLGTAASYGEDLTISSDAITITLDYNNNGNPSANAYLDYINIEATRALRYEGNQLIFRNRDVITTPGIAEYSVSNASGVQEIWDITDRFNVTNLLNSDNQGTMTFKALSGEEKTYVA